MTRSPVILFDARLVLEKPTGIGQYIASLIPELVKQAPDWQFHIIQKPKTFVGYGLNDWTFPNLKKQLSNEPHMNLRQHIMLPRLASKLKADLLHYPHFDAPVAFQTVPVVATIYDTKYLTQPNFFQNLSQIKNHYMRFSYANTLKRAAQVMAISHATAQDLEQLFGKQRKPIHVTQLAADPAFKPQSAEKIATLRQTYQLQRPFILSVGERRPHKNFGTLIRAYQQSAASQTHDLVIIGQRYQDYQELEDLIKTNRLESSVHLLDRISFPDLITFYSAADLFVLVSLYEGYGLPVVEAMACHTAVVASNTTALAEVTGDGGWQVDPLNMAEITHALDTLIQNKDLRQQWVEKGKTWVNRFSWERAAAETLQVYKQALNGKQRS